MSEREAEPADVRPFLPRPGEPVEEYAERLRSMHRDLSVVLQAVERGLARTHEPEPIVPVREPEPEPAPVAAPAGGPIPHGTARVEVVRSGRGHRAEDETVEDDWVEEPPPPPPPPEGQERRHSRGRPLADRPSREPGRAAGTDPWPPAAPPLADRPSADPHRGWPEPGLAPAPRRPEPPAFTPASYPGPWPEPSQRRGPMLPPWAIAAILAGWLTIVALLLAVLLEG